MRGRPRERRLAAGNRTETTVGAESTTWYYRYDHLNHLTLVQEFDAETGGSPIAEPNYSYDVFGNRLTRFDGPEEDHFGYDGWNVHQDGQGNRSQFVGQENWSIWGDFDFYGYSMRHR